MRGRCWARRCTGPLDERVRDRIVAETRGNPLALLELPRGADARRAGRRLRLPGARPLPGRIEERFRRRLERAAGRDPAAAAGRGGRAGRRPALVWRAAARLGIAVDAAAPAAAAGLRRDRRARALPPSARALGGLPGGVARGAAAAHRALARGHGSRGRSRPSRLARRAGVAGAGRGRRRGTRAVGRAGASTRRAGGGGGVPRTGGRAHRRSRPPGRARARRGPGRAAGRRAGGRPAVAVDRRRRARSTSCSGPGWSCCARGSPSP